MSTAIRRRQATDAFFFPGHDKRRSSAAGYLVEEDASVTVLGEVIDVRVFYPGDDDGIDVFRLQDDEPAGPDISGLLAHHVYRELLERAQEEAERMAERELVLARDEYEEMKYRMETGK